MKTTEIAFNTKLWLPNYCSDGTLLLRREVNQTTFRALFTTDKMIANYNEKKKIFEVVFMKGDLSLLGQKISFTNLSILCEEFYSPDAYYFSYEGKEDTGCLEILGIEKNNNRIALAESYF